MRLIRQGSSRATNTTEQEGESIMKADRIIKNAKIFTADKEKPLASALAVKDGRFIYVGDEDGSFASVTSPAPLR